MHAELVRPAWVIVGITLCLLGVVAGSCRSPLPPTMMRPTTPPPVPTAVTPAATMALSPTPLLTARFVPTPATGLPLLSDAEAVTLMKEAVLRYGAKAESVRVSLVGERRSVAVRYASTLSAGQGTFDVQRTLSTMAVARIVVRLDPPPAGGLSVGIIPAGDENDVGLLLTLIDGEVLARWARGELNDAEFVRQWEMGAMTRQ